MNNDNRGVLFVNNSRTSTKQPNFKGTAIIGGTRYKVSVWENMAKSGATYYNLAFSLDEKGSPQDIPDGEVIPFQRGEYGFFKIINISSKFCVWCFCL